MSSFEQNGESGWGEIPPEGQDSTHETFEAIPLDGYSSSNIVREEEHGDEIAPQTIDDLFDTYTRYPDTAEDYDRLRALEKTNALRWLGGDGYHPSLLYQFAAPTDIPENTTEDGLVTHADAIAHKQLVNFSHSFATTNDGIAATEALSSYIAEDVDMPLISRSALPQSPRHHTFRAGQFLIQPQDDRRTLITIIQARQTVHEHNLIRYNKPDGGIHFVDPTAQVRYRYTTGGDGPAMIKEQPVALYANDPEYFAKLNELLKQQHDILRHVAFEFGINPRFVDNFEDLTLKGGFTPNFVADAEINTFLQKRGPSLALAIRLIANTGAITDMVRPQRIPNPATGKLEHTGLITVASRVQRYYSAVRTANAHRQP